MAKTIDTRCDDLDALAKKLQAEGIRYVQIETPDLNGTLRGKLTTVKKALAPNGGAFCTILYGMSMVDDIVESPHSSFANGFPDGVVVADPASVTLLDPDRGIASVVCDMFDESRVDYYALSPRTALRRAVERAERAGFSARFAIEIELFVVRVDEAAVASGRHHEQLPLGRSHNAYSLARMDELRALAAEFMDRMAALGIVIEAIHTELGYGMIEVALTHMPALQAADACARVKLYLKEFLSRHGFAAVYMPKWRVEESGSGGHVHQSLWRNGKPAFAGEDGAFSEVGRRYVAGQLATLADFAAIFYPTINSYRRMEAAAWSPESLSWGFDNRTCALRTITQPSAAAFRIEHRCPGADVNPYLAIAAMLVGGVYGIEEGLEAPPPIKGNAAEVEGLRQLPRSLEEATALLESSKLARELMGPDLVGQIVRMRERECELWRDWQRRTITQWELSRYFDAH